jgi:hypothetical protein
MEVKVTVSERGNMWWKATGRWNMSTFCLINVGPGIQVTQKNYMEVDANLTCV